MAPRVSVLMPVYNGAAFLAETVESILQQSFIDFEFLILDDGSTDGSLGILEAYARNEPRIRLISRENRGISRTRNDLAAMAMAELLAFTDQDDVSHPQRLAKQVAWLDAHPETDVLGGFVRMCEARLRPIFVLDLPFRHEEIDHAHLDGHNSIIQSTTMVRKATFETVGGYDPAFDTAEDIELWLRIGEIGRLANLPEVLVDYRLHDTSGSTTGLQRQSELAGKAGNEARARRGLPSKLYSYSPWRPENSRTSRHDFALDWGWRAWSQGYRASSRRYFIKAIRIAPLSLAAWKALIFGTLRHPVSTDRSTSDQ